MIVIPKSVQRELQSIEKKKPVKKPKEEKYSPEELLAKAIENLKFLNEIAQTEPIHSFLQQREASSIKILDRFTPYYPDLVPDPCGGLWLESRMGKTGLFYWLDADYPVNRSERNHTFITEPDIREWDPKSIARFAALTEKEIWRAIEKWLRLYREHFIGTV